MVWSLSLFLAGRPVFAETVLPTNTPALPAFTNALPVLPPITNAMTVIVPPSTATKKAPPRRAEEMTTAFKTVGGTRFGVYGTQRILKLPERPIQRKNDDWVRTLELGLDTARGNSDILRYNAGVSARKEDEKNVYWLKLGGRYGESDNVKDTESAQGEGKYERGLTERVYASLNIMALHDQIADLSYRVLGNVSLGRHLVWTEQTILNVELGPGYVREKKGGMQDGFVAGRIANYFERLLNSSVRLWQSSEYVPNLEDIGVYYATAEVGLETLLVRNICLKFVVQDRYDNSPAEGKKKNDLLTTTSLNWMF
ncbi:MAG: hypothetical protein A2X46_18980 [Lentisphaerae bacterium GWF2_57_35]|nr:MAG: hypothetical protein A2X46_18980 [Lentisphaerae bacterium GWF2_57_35]